MVVVSRVRTSDDRRHQNSGELVVDGGREGSGFSERLLSSADEKIDLELPPLLIEAEADSNQLLPNPDFAPSLSLSPSVTSL